MKAPAKQIAPQTAWDMQSDAEKDDEVEAVKLWRAALWSAMRTFAKSYIADDGQQGYAACAAALDKFWGEEGRPVSESTLGAALLAGQVKLAKTKDEYIEDLEAEIRETNPKHADQIIRRARVRNR